MVTMSPESTHKSPTQQVTWAALEPHDVNTAQNLTALTQLRKTPGKKVPPGGSRSEASRRQHPSIHHVHLTFNSPSRVESRVSDDPR